MSCQLCCPTCGSFLEIAATVKSKPVERRVSLQEMRFSLDRYKLSPRMREAAEHLLDGMSNSQISEEMEVGVQVVKNYLKAVYDKVGCSSRTELMWMVMNGRRK